MAADVTSAPVLLKRIISAFGTVSRMSSATSTSSGCIIENVMPSASCSRIARSTASYAYPSDSGPIAMLRSMNSLPSTSHTCAPLPRCRYLGATPPTYWPGPLASVCVPAGMSASARAYHSLERVMTGSRRSAVATSGMGITSGFLAARKRSGDALREPLGGKSFVVENVGEQCRTEPPAGQRYRMQSDGDLIRGGDLGDDRRETADGKVVLDG